MSDKQMWHVLHFLATGRFLSFQMQCFDRLPWKAASHWNLVLVDSISLNALNLLRRLQLEQDCAVYEGRPCAPWCTLKPMLKRSPAYPDVITPCCWSSIKSWITTALLPGIHSLSLNAFQWSYSCWDTSNHRMKFCHLVHISWTHW